MCQKYWKKNIAISLHQVPLKWFSRSAYGVLFFEFQIIPRFEASVIVFSNVCYETETRKKVRRIFIFKVICYKFVFLLFNICIERVIHLVIRATHTKNWQQLRSRTHAHSISSIFNIAQRSQSFHFAWKRFESETNLMTISYLEHTMPYS